MFSLVSIFNSSDDALLRETLKVLIKTWISRLDLYEIPQGMSFSLCSPPLPIPGRTTSKAPHFFAVNSSFLRISQLTD